MKRNMYEIPEAEEIKVQMEKNFLDTTSPGPGGGEGLDDPEHD